MCLNCSYLFLIFLQFGDFYGMFLRNVFSLCARNEVAILGPVEA